MGIDQHIHKATGKPLHRGARPTPRHLLAAASPFKPKAAPPPFFFIFPQKLSMWGNGPDPQWPNPSGNGNCVSADEAYNKACNGVFIEDTTLYAWCVANGTLDGANLQPVIQQMQAAGFSQDGNVYGDGAPLAVNYGDAPTLQAAIYEAGQQGGCLKAGVAANELPSDAGNVNGWFMLTNLPDTNEDHCMPVCGFGTVQQFVDAINAAFPGTNLVLPAGIDPSTQGYAMFTWNTIGFVSVSAFLNFTGEVWMRNPSTVTTGTGKPDPDPVYVVGGPTPGPVPPSPTPGPTPTPTPTPPPVPTPTPAPTFPTATVTIPDQVIQIPIGPFFRTGPVTIPGGTYPVVYQSAPTDADFCVSFLTAAIVNGEGALISWAYATRSLLYERTLAGQTTLPPWLIPAILDIVRSLCSGALFPVPKWVKPFCALVPPAGSKCAGC